MSTNHATRSTKRIIVYTTFIISNEMANAEPEICETLKLNLIKGIVSNKCHVIVDELINIY